MAPRLAAVTRLAALRRPVQPWRVVRHATTDQRHPLARGVGFQGARSGVKSRGQWSNATLIALATLTGTTTYVIASYRKSDLARDLPRHSEGHGDAEQFERALSELRGLLGEDRVSQDQDMLESKGYSEWSYHSHAPPKAIVWPQSTAECSKIMAICVRYKVPIVPTAGCTSLEGHFASPVPGICVDFRDMDKILQVNAEDGDVVVQPAVQWELLNKQLEGDGIPLFFPIDPGPTAMVGGMVGTGCSGTNAVRYGTMKGEWVLNLTVVLPDEDGTVIKTRSRARKSSAGFDLTKLFIGAEGTLGLVTEATLRLAPRLPTSVAVCAFPSVENAVEAVREIVNSGAQVACVELLDDVMMKAVNLASSGKHYPEKPSLFLKFSGTDVAMKDDAKRVSRIIKDHRGGEFQFAAGKAEADELWRGRKEALWSAMALVEGSRCWTTDVCVPISKLPQLVRETKEDFARSKITAPIVGHVGDGNFHALVLFSNDDELALVRQLVHRMVQRAQDLEGTCTGEHGIGMGKIEHMVRELGPGTVDVMKRIKQTLDPYNICNPGKLYP